VIKLAWIGTTEVAPGREPCRAFGSDIPIRTDKAGQAMAQDPFFTPVSGFDLPRFAGVPTFMRLPHVPPDHPRFAEVEIGLIGAPWDGGTTNRPGPRHGPRALRDASTMMRAQNGITGVRPFEAVACADLGDVPPNPADLMDSLARMERFYTEVRAAGIRPLTAGGDHLCSLPILRALAKGAALGDGAFRQSFRSVPFLLRGVDVYPWHALPPCSGRRAA
jgi:hypothetical protein